jgi:hypothetical protein
MHCPHDLDPESDVSRGAQAGLRPIGRCRIGKLDRLGRLGKLGWLGKLGAAEGAVDTEQGSAAAGAITAIGTTTDAAVAKATVIVTSRVNAGMSPFGRQWFAEEMYRRQ